MNSLSMNLLLAAEETTVKAAEGAAGAAGDWKGWLVFLVILAVIVLPFVLGTLIARWLKMRDYATKIGLVLFSLTLALGPFVTRWVSGQNPLSAISLGIDLAGGTNMEFAVNRQEAEATGKQITNEVMDKMVAAVSRRVNPTGTEEVTVRRVGADRIEVIVPGADQEKVQATKRKIVDLGKLEFSVLANEVDHQDLIQLADSLGDKVKEIFRNNQLIGKWRPAAVTAETGEPKVQPGDRVHVRTVEVNGKPQLQYLVVVNPDPAQRIDGDLLKQVRETVTDRGLAVGFTFNDRGGHLMQQLTSKYQPRTGAGYKTRLAVLLNEEVHSAPTINAVIGSTGVIEGSFTQDEINDLVNVLNAGALQVPLYREPVSEFTVSPTLGSDVQRKGLSAMAVSIVAVLAVTLVYYLVCGFIADLCLLLNLILVLGAMSLIDATFTLPGLAGLVLSIGMAVDSNVLIFERMREERQRGSSMRMAIKNGFEKAFSTIFDSNVTTLITAVVLYYIGTEQVKGFAVTLFIGIVISMFTAVYVGRIIFDIAEQKKWITDLKMMNIVPTGNFDFLGKRYIAVGISLLVMILGLLLVGYRGKDNLDIDFRGGSMVAFKFDGESPTVDEVRAALDKKFEKSISLERLSINEAGKEQVLFRMRTIESNPKTVSDNIRAAFAETPLQLVQQHIQIGEVTPIAKSETPLAADAAPDLFAGGHKVVVKLSQETLPASLAEQAAIFLADQKKLDKPQDLVIGQGIDQVEGKAKEIRLRFAASVPEADIKNVLADFTQKMEGAPHFEEINTFAAAVAGDAQKSALLAIALSFLAIIIYLWVRFQRVTFGLAACVALVHDVLITLGLVAFGAYFSGNAVGQFLMLEDFKINLTIVAAFLTIIGYSLNDTIVVFDRIREVRGRNPLLTEKMINQSLNQTLSRTLLTSVTTLIVVFIMYIMGGEGIHGFAYCLMLGILVGTFSSIYVASPVLLWLTNRRIQRTTVTA
ncbi:protein translocase subunit SecD [Planctomicrobium piriforme]|uniref:Multifunctional fusion protein n=1 Tax=Planctomicrobium piriforme TaxID=1576369 RepID=A0A1I3HH21_9PLAN|nr:protein translocase subunit SecD [Planctomicrobium piriforme]SFI34972.1 SecD/SecF fusion protein [Planctomicrobium piriforme]